MFERIRLKVWSGEVLSDGELDALKRAARPEAGVRAEAGEWPEALRLLERLRRDYPADERVHLALGRALIAMERWREAEVPLGRALELNPTDPEPKKAMATVALRRAEWRRARSLVEDVLKADPIDAEARLLMRAVEAAEPGAQPSAPTAKDFIAALSDRLQRQSTPHLLQEAMLLLRLGRGAVARIDLEALFAETVRSPRSLDVAVDAMADELAERSLGLQPGRGHLLSRVLPLLRDSTFLERGVGAVRREGPSGLWFTYAVDDPELVLYVSEGALAAARVTLEELDDAAWRNLEARPTDVRALDVERGVLRLSTTPTGLWGLVHGDGHDAARLLTASHQAAIAKAVGPGPYRVYLGLRELLLLCPAHDDASIAKLDALIPAHDGIRGTWSLSDGRLCRLSD